MKKTRGYISIYTLIVFVLLVSIIMVLILGIRMESKKVINKEDYYQNKLIARSVYHMLMADEDFVEFTKDPTEENLKKVTRPVPDIDCYEDNVRLSYGKNNRGVVVSYAIHYKNTVTNNNIVIETNKSKLLNSYSKVKLKSEEIEQILENDLEKLGDDLVFYQDGETLYYLQRNEYEDLLKEIEDSFNNEEEEIIEEDALEEPNEELPEVIEIDIANYLDKFKVLEGDYFYDLKSFEVLSTEAPHLKGIGVLEDEGEKLGKLWLDGILINHSAYKDIKVNGKVVEVSKYNGYSIRSKESILRLKDSISLDLDSKVHRLMIK